MVKFLNFNLQPRVRHLAWLFPVHILWHRRSLSYHLIHTLVIVNPWPAKFILSSNLFLLPWTLFHDILELNGLGLICLPVQDESHSSYCLIFISFTSFYFYHLHYSKDIQSVTPILTSVPSFICILLPTCLQVEVPRRHVTVQYLVVTSCMFSIFSVVCDECLVGTQKRCIGKSRIPFIQQMNQSWFNVIMFVGIIWKKIFQNTWIWKVYLSSYNNIYWVAYTPKYNQHSLAILNCSL